MGDDSPTVAVLGTGIMGAAIAGTLLRRGLGVRAWNRTRAKAEPLAEQGAIVADSPVAAAAGADVVLTVLYDADAVLGAMTDEDGAIAGMAPRSVWIQASTVGVAGTAQLAKAATQHDTSFVDAPVLGTRQPAERGQLVVLASGPPELEERCAPVFDAMGNWRWLGPAGAGSRLKLVVNSWVLAVTGAVAEAVALARGLDLDPQLFLDTIAGSQVDTPYAHLKGGAMIHEEFSPSFTLRSAHKDAQLVLEAAAAAGVDTVVADAVARQFGRGLELGHGEEDMAATYRALAPDGSR